MNVSALSLPSFPAAFCSPRLSRQSTTQNSSIKRKHDIVYGGIIQSANDRFLLVRGRHSGKWSFPKGHIEPGETALECVCREIREETGYNILPKPLRCVPLHGGTYYLFWMPVEPDPVPRDINEISEAGWFSREEIKHMKTNVGVSSFFNAAPLICAAS